MLTYPYIDPVAFNLGPLSVRWYGLAYAAGLCFAWLMGRYCIQRQWGIFVRWNQDVTAFEDRLFQAMFALIIGGRLGYMLFYTHFSWVQDPGLILRVWEGGMSFHGALLGVVLWLLVDAYRQNYSLIDLSDTLAVLTPVGLGLGRLANFINGELVGRPSTLPWAMVFPWIDNAPRHPSQLYEMLAEGIFLSCILWWLAAKKPAPGRLTSVFLIGYAMIRLLIEQVREPDAGMGFILAQSWTMGQLLSLPMIGLALWIWYRFDGMQADSTGQNNPSGQMT